VARRVVWTETAARDLEQAAHFIALDSPRYAAAFVREVQTAARSLSEMAGRGRIVPEFSRRDIRELFVRNHRLVYHLSRDEVSIIGFIHGARDLGGLWDREQRTPLDDAG
jgi:toxin ParE1/3/4